MSTPRIPPAQAVSGSIRASITKEASHDVPDRRWLWLELLANVFMVSSLRMDGVLIVVVKLKAGIMPEYKNALISIP